MKKKKKKKKKKTVYRDACLFLEYIQIFSVYVKQINYLFLFFIFVKCTFECCFFCFLLFSFV